MVTYPRGPLVTVGVPTGSCYPPSVTKRDYYDPQDDQRSDNDACDKHIEIDRGCNRNQEEAR
jgi:hypothetical protein